jgi:hypothetical protein
LKDSIKKQAPGFPQVLHPYCPQLDLVRLSGGRFSELADSLHSPVAVDDDGHGACRRELACHLPGGYLCHDLCPEAGDAWLQARQRGGAGHGSQGKAAVDQYLFVCAPYLGRRAFRLWHDVSSYLLKSDPLQLNGSRQLTG